MAGDVLPRICTRAGCKKVFRNINAGLLDGRAPSCTCPIPKSICTGIVASPQLKTFKEGIA